MIYNHNLKTYLPLFGGNGAPAILDLYSGATAAYSVRLLKSTYVGKCLRIRRTSDFNEMDFGFVGGYLDLAAVTAFVGLNSGFVVKWYNQLGNSSFDILQTTNSKQPRLTNVVGTVNLVNGKAAIHFNAANLQNLITAGTVQPQTGDFLITVVGNTHTTVGNGAIIDQDDQVTLNGRVSQYIYRDLNTFRQLTFNTAGSFTIVNSPTFSANVQQVYNSQKVANILSAGINNVNNTSGLFTGTVRTTAVKLTVGAGNNGTGDFFDGMLQEILFFDGNQNANRAAIIANQRTYFNF